MVVVGSIGSPLLARLYSATNETVATNQDTTVRHVRIPFLYIQIKLQLQWKCHLSIQVILFETISKYCSYSFHYLFMWLMIYHYNACYVDFCFAAFILLCLWSFCMLLMVHKIPQANSSIQFVLFRVYSIVVCIFLLSALYHKHFVVIAILTYAYCQLAWVG